MKYFNKEIKKRYITDEPDNAIDIREVFPEVDSTITIIGDLKNIMNEKQYKILQAKDKIQEVGFDGRVSYLTLTQLFTLEDVINKIKELEGNK